MIYRKPAHLVYQHENPEEAGKFLQHGPETTPQKIYAKLGKAETTSALVTLILMGGRQIEEYEIKKTVLGTYSAKRKASSSL